MNEHEVRGAVRHVKGRAESVVGSIAGDLGRQVEGAYDQVAGGVQHAYGRAAETAEQLIERGRDFAGDAGTAAERYAGVARHRAARAGEAGSDLFREARSVGTSYAREATRYADDNRMITLVGVAAAAFVIGWLVRPSGRT